MTNGTHPYTELHALEDMVKFVVMCQLVALFIFRIVEWLVCQIARRITKKEVVYWGECLVLYLLLPLTVFLVVGVSLTYGMVVYETRIMSYDLWEANLVAQYATLLRVMQNLAHKLE